MPAGWLVHFSPFSSHHAAVVGVSAMVTWIVVRYARTVRGTRQELHVRATWALMTLSGEIGSTIVWMLPARYSKGGSWPIHLCDFAAWLIALAMLSPARWPRTILFFWGIGLSTQGFLTPTADAGLLSAEYWVFWIQHLGVVGGAVYLAAVNGYRPTLRDLGFAIAVTLGLVVFMVWLNRAAGTNYMYLGDSLPEKPTLLDVLGDYPGRLIWIVLLGTIGLVLTYLGSEAAHLLHRGLARQTETGEPPRADADH